MFTKKKSINFEYFILRKSKKIDKIEKWFYKRHLAIFPNKSWFCPIFLWTIFGHKLDVLLP